MNNKNICSTEYHPFQSFKTLAWFDRMKAIKTGNFMAPVNIALDIVQGTNNKKICGKGFRCNFCMSDFEDQGEEARIPSEILFKIPEFYNKWGVKSICLAGHHSDPTMYNNKDLITFLRLCNRWNIEVGFVTNGAYMSKHLMEEVVRTCNWCGLSINAGNENDHAVITNTEKGTFNKIIDNIKYMSNYIKEYHLDCDLGYKFLVTDDNYMNTYEAIKLASEIGIRHFQLRPTQLTEERTEKINTEEVERQLKEGIKLERKGEFEVFGIREKFTTDFKKITPWKCIASPLGSTWKADGSICICPDRRWSVHKPNMSLGNFITEGLESIRRKWGGKEHLAMIEEANKHIGECIRCTSIKWHDLYYHTVENDSMDITLI